MQANVSVDIKHHSALCGSDYYAISNIWLLLFFTTAKVQISNSITIINQSLEFNSQAWRCHKTSLFSYVLILRSSLTASQKQLNGFPVNLLLSSSLAHASQAAAARISKENSGLFKHPVPTHTHTHTLQASEVKESGEGLHTHISPYESPHTYTHIQTLRVYLWAAFVKLRLSWILLSGQIRYRPGRPKKKRLGILLQRVCFHQPYENETNTFCFVKYWPKRVSSSECSSEEI